MSDDSRPGDSRPGDSRPDDSRPDDSRPGDSRPDDSRPDDSRPDDSRPDDSRPDDSRPDYSRPDYSRPDDSRPDDSRPGDSRPGDSKPGNARAAAVVGSDHGRPRSLPTVLWFFVAIVVAFVLHPKWMNVNLSFFSASDEPVPLNYVDNFYLWTRSNSASPQKLVVGSMEALTRSYFRPRKTFVIIHGFTRTGLVQWIVRMKDALLGREDCNVISVDWRAGSITAGYYVIRERVPFVGEDVAKLVRFLEAASKGGALRLHIIGHSLGAHVAGFAGKKLEGSVERITGLDPAGLSFNGAAPDLRLASSDAAFVDVIHTHGCYTIVNQLNDCYGTYDNIGDADFWPNGGERQPACAEGGDGTVAVAEHSNCDHGMAYVFFTHSILFPPTSTRFAALRCESFDRFLNGSCDDCGRTHTQYMGYNANPSVRGVFFLNTSSTAPYGLLEPRCSPAQFSAIRIIGVTVCLHLVLIALVHTGLSLTSILTRKEAARELTARWSAAFGLSFGAADSRSGVAEA